jgi:hypothetical protein
MPSSTKLRSENSSEYQLASGLPSSSIRPGSGVGIGSKDTTSASPPPNMAQRRTVSQSSTPSSFPHFESRDTTGERTETQAQRSNSERHTTSGTEMTTPRPNSRTPTRPRTPEGPRSVTKDSPRQNVSVSALLENPASSSRTEMNRSTASREPNRFRVPPPTGPRAASIAASGSSLRTQNRSASGSERTGTVGQGVLNGSSVGVREKAENPIGSVAPIPGVRLKTNSDRPLASTTSHGDASRHANSEHSADSQSSTWSRLQTQTQPSASRKESMSSVDVPRGPSEKRYHPKRDLQDEDPRRLSRNPAWADDFRAPGGSVHEGESRRSNHSSVDEAPSVRALKGTEEQSQSAVPPSSRETRQGQVRTTKRDEIEPKPGNRARDEEALSTSSDCGESLRPVNVTEHLGAKAEGSDPEGSRQVANGGQDERKIQTLGRAETSIRSEGKSAVNTEERVANNRDPSPRPKSEREATPRRDDSKDSRHIARDSHHRRLTHRSPSRTSTDRNDRKERERGSDKGMTLRRENRDLDNKEKGFRDEGYRRESRDRERSSRDRSQEGRRSSRKHERDRSSDKSGKHGRLGEMSSTEDANLPQKRRRVGR